MADLDDDLPPSLYDQWHWADGLHKPEAWPKWIFFRNGFVRVRKPDYETTLIEAWAENREKTFYVPEGHYCEVHRAEIKFTKT